MIKVKDLIKSLETINKEAIIKLSSDEELNILFNEFRIGKLDKNAFVLFGLSGSEDEY